MLRWTYLLMAIGLAVPSMGVTPAFAEEAAERPPNVIIVFADDMGYGDLGCFGHPTIRTPNLDRMAANGQKWTNFYSAAPLCTPSRASLLTGRYPMRVGLPRVLYPNSTTGLPAEELTLAEHLKAGGYATACIGKWHLGHLDQFLPTEHGFDYYFGLPYSNDMDADREAGFNGRESMYNGKSHYWNLPLMRNKEIIERPAQQETLTKRYTEEAVKFIRDHKDEPFFIYLPHTQPHVPLFRSKEFEGRSERGIYGDVIEEIDWSVGQIIATLEELQIDDNTLVVFTSDNGPWLPYGEHGGSAGLLREGKSTVYEGGMRVPTIFYWPGRIQPDVVMDMGAMLDMLPTVAALTDTPLPDDLALDGMDLSSVLLSEGDSPRDTFFYWRWEALRGVRHGSYKLLLPAKEEEPVQLFNLSTDPSEKHNIAERHPDIVASLEALIEEHRATFEEK